MKKDRPLMRVLVIVLVAISALMSTAARAYAYDATGQSRLARPAAVGGFLIATTESLQPMLTGTSPLVSTLAAAVEHIHFEAYENGFVVENTYAEIIP